MIGVVLAWLLGAILSFSYFKKEETFEKHETKEAVIASLLWPIFIWIVVIAYAVACWAWSRTKYD